MRISKFFLIFCLLFPAANGFAFQLSGLIKDQDNQPVPYASVYINQTTYGVSSNIKGEYFMELKNGEYDIVFYAMGFEKKSLRLVIADKNLQKNVTLALLSTQLTEIAVSTNAKDPAYEIMKKTIAARERYRSPVETAKYNAYIKSSLEKEQLKRNGISKDSVGAPTGSITKERMNLIESYSEVYYKQPDKIKEIKTGYRDLSEKRKGNLVSIRISTDDDEQKTDFVNSNLFKTNISDADFNFYYNNISVTSLGASPLVSPLSNMAFLSYEFHLEEYMYEDHYGINKIKVTPKRTDASLFTGYIYIVDSLWCIKAIDLEIDPAALYTFSHFRIIQKYEHVVDNAWMLSSEEFFYNTKEGKKTILGNTYIKYSDYNLNFPIPNSYFRNELSVTVDSAYNRNTTFWKHVRPITLKGDELKFITKQDSIEEYHKSPELDILTKVYHPFLRKVYHPFSFKPSH